MRLWIQRQANATTVLLEFFTFNGNAHRNAKIILKNNEAANLVISSCLCSIGDRRLVQHWCQEPTPTEAASSVLPAISFEIATMATAAAAAGVQAAAGSELIVGTAVSMAPAGATSLP